jgi:hypothetical protein
MIGRLKYVEQFVEREMAGKTELLGENLPQSNFALLNCNVSGLCPLSGILKEQNVSEAGSVPFLRRKGIEAFTHLGTLERANLSHRRPYPFS